MAVAPAATHVRGRTTLATVSMMMAIAATYSFGLYLLPSIIDRVRDDLAVPNTTTAAINTVTRAGFLAGAVTCATAKLRLPADQLIVTSVAVCAAALAGVSLLPEPWMLTAPFAALGATAAIAWVPMAEVVTRYVPPRARGRSLGFISSGTNYGLVINGLLIATLAGWRTPFFIASLLTAAITTSLWVALRGLSTSANADQPGVPAPHDSDTDVPVPRLPSVVVIIAACAALAGYTFTNSLSTYAADELGMRAGALAVAWSVLGLGGIASGVGLGIVADHIGPLRTIAVAQAASAAGCLLIVITSASSSVTIAALLVAVGFFPVFALLPAYISLHASPRRTTTIHAWVNISAAIAGIVAAIAPGLITDRIQTLRPVYAAAALASAIGATLAATYHHRHH